MDPTSETVVEPATNAQHWYNLTIFHYIRWVPSESSSLVVWAVYRKALVVRTYM
jgi:hypothetical protein